MNKMTTVSEEACGFLTEDILVSRTDDRGRILAANKRFQVVSGFDWESLHHAPHKVVRHPDMPKGVFWLFWDTLKRKEPIGAFVKNRTQDGNHYWVFAFAAPLAEGYVSVRIKPSDEALTMIASEYNKLLLREQGESLTPAESALGFLARLKELGYNNYGHFMCKMALQQLAARTEALDRNPQKLIDGMDNLTKLWGDVRVECDKIFEAHELIAHTPNNLSVQAAHLSERGIPLSVIAANFTVLANEISDMMKIFRGQAERVDEQLDKSAFLVCTERLMEEVVEVYNSETTEMAGIVREHETKVMLEQRQSCFQKTIKMLKQVGKEIDAFVSLLEETSQVLSGLSVAKVMCEIENTYISTAQNSSIKDIIGELERFQSDTRSSLFMIRQLLFEIGRTIRQVQSEIEVSKIS